VSYQNGGAGNKQIENSLCSKRTRPRRVKAYRRRSSARQLGESGCPVHQELEELATHVAGDENEKASRGRRMAGHVQDPLSSWTSATAACRPNESLVFGDIAFWGVLIFGTERPVFFLLPALSLPGLAVERKRDCCAIVTCCTFSRMNVQCTSARPKVSSRV
jgi:hypothetical protein